MRVLTVLPIGPTWVLFSEQGWTHIFLGKVDEILQVDVIAVGFDVIVDEEVELVFDPVLKDEGEDPRSQLQKEDQTQEHRKLESHMTNASVNTPKLTKNTTGVLSLQSRTWRAPKDKRNFVLRSEGSSYSFFLSISCQGIALTAALM